MSVDIHVFFDPARLPSPAQWATAARAAGFSLDIDTDIEPKTFAGFLPCRYQDKEAGFEYFYQVLEGRELHEWGIGDSSRPACISFSTRSNFREFASSMIASAVLCSLTDGVLRDADGETTVSCRDVLEWAREGEESVQSDIAEQENPAPSPVRPAVSIAAPIKKPWWKVW